MSDKTPVEIIQAIVGAEYGVTVAEMISHDRHEPIATARRHAVYLCYQLTGINVSRLFVEFGYSEHTGVLYARDSIKDQLQTDRDLVERNHRLLFACIEATGRTEGGPVSGPATTPARVNLLEAMENAKLTYTNATRDPARARFQIDTAIEQLGEARLLLNQA